MTNASSAGLRELCVSEIEAVSGGFDFSSFFISAPFRNVDGRFTLEVIAGLASQAGPDKFQNYATARQLQAAYAANPDTPKSQVYADFFLL